MTKLLYTTIFFLSFLAVNAQDLTPKKIQDKLEDIDTRINQLFQKIDKPLYSSYVLESTYAGYTKIANGILDELDALEKGAKQLSGEYNSDKDFYIRLANMNICQLKIRHNKESLLSHLKFKTDPQIYHDQIALWEKKEGAHQKDLRKQIEKIRLIEQDNIYASIFESVALFFEGNSSNAIDKLGSIIKLLSSKNRPQLSEDEIDNLIGFCNSWQAYFYFQAGKISEFNEHVVNTIASKGPAPSISWANDAKRAFEKNKKEGTDLFIRKFSPETSNVTRNFYSNNIMFDEKGRITAHKLDETTLKYPPTPNTIAANVEIAYNRLNDLEKSLWTSVQENFNKDAKKEKAMYKDPAKVMYEINPDKKTKNSIKPLNIVKVVNLANQYNDLVKELIMYRSVWNNLIKSNPDIPLFRLYRIKTDLLIQKIYKDSPRYLRAFEYLKYASKKIERPSNATMSEFRDQLKQDLAGEIRTDLQYLEKLIPESPALSITKLEVALLIDGPEATLGLVQTLSAKLSPELMIENQRPAAYFSAAEVCAMFNQKKIDAKEYKDAVNALSDYSFAEGFLSSIKNKATFVREERETIAKFKKQPLYRRYLPESCLPMIYFPKDIKCSYVTAPPLFMAQSIKLTLDGVASQYFRIAILPVLDMTNRAESYRNSITDMFYTSLFETKRFSLMDRMEVTRVQDKLSQSIQEKMLNRMDSKNEANAQDTSAESKNTAIVNKKEEMELLNKLFQKNDASQTEYKEIANQLQNNAEGVLLLYITNDLKSVDGYGGKVGIDYRIISTKSNDVLFAGNKDIGYRFDKKSETLLFDRQDVAAVANEIKLKFPNPDLQDNLKIIARRGNRITINAGKANNITTGLEGFVIKVEEDLSGNKLIRYRAEFIVKDVFPETFNAELIGDAAIGSIRNQINPTIEVGEQVKMK